MSHSGSGNVIYSKKENSADGASSRKEKEKENKPTTLKAKLGQPVDQKKLIKEQLEKKNNYAEKILKENSTKFEEKKSSSTKEVAGQNDKEKDAAKKRKNKSESGLAVFGLSNGFHTRAKSTATNNYDINNHRYSGVDDSNKAGAISKSSEKIKNSNREEKEHPVLDEKQKRERQYAYEKYLKENMPPKPKPAEFKDTKPIQKNNFFIPTLIKEKATEHKKKSSSDKTMPSLSDSVVLLNRQKLLEDYQLNLIKNREKEKNKESSQKNDKISKKLKYLSDKGRLEKILNENDMEMGNDEDNYLNDKFEEEEKGEKSKHDSQSNRELSEGHSQPHLRNESSSYPSNNSRSKPLVHNRNYSEVSSSSNRNKLPFEEVRAKKPKVDSFDYYKKIGMNVEENADVENEIENSFRKSFNIKIQKIINPEERRKRSVDENHNKNKQIKVDNRTYQVYDEENKFVFSYRQKSSNADRNELKSYIKESKKKNKEEKIKLEQEETERNCKIYFNLMSLHEKTCLQKKTNTTDKDNSNHSINYVSKRGKKMIRNDSYLGNRRLNKSKNEDSSIIDEEQYLKDMCDFKEKILPQALPKKRRVRSAYNYPEGLSKKQNNLMINQEEIADMEIERENESERDFNIRVKSEDTLKKSPKNNQGTVHPVSHDEFVNLMESQRALHMRSVDSNDLISEKSPMSHKTPYKENENIISNKGGRTQISPDNQKKHKVDNINSNKKSPTKVEISPKKEEPLQKEENKNPYRNNNSNNRNENSGKNVNFNKKDVSDAKIAKEAKEAKENKELIQSNKKEPEKLNASDLRNSNSSENKNNSNKINESPIERPKLNNNPVKNTDTYEEPKYNESPAKPKSQYQESPEPRNKLNNQNHSYERSHQSPSEGRLSHLSQDPLQYREPSQNDFDQGKEVQEEYVDEGELSEEEYNYHIVI